MRQGRLNADPAQMVARGPYPPPGEVPAAGRRANAGRAPWQPRWTVGTDYSAQEVVCLCTARSYWAEEAHQRKAAAPDGARALFQRRRGVWIIGLGFAGGRAGVFGWLLGRDLLAVTASSFLNAYADLVLYLSAVTMFTMPGLGISLYLAREFALDAELLQVKLTKVARLSAQTLAQEQEKQALLAAQNETLEQQVIGLVFDLAPQPVPLDLLPFELGQVVQSLVRNACYTLAGKSKTTKDFVPEPRVSTQVAGGRVMVRMRDNGKGIPARELPKLFTPFFTTKPTSKGTGLGLFMAKDIVELHQGHLRIDTREGEFTEISLVLPLPAEQVASSVLRFS